MVAESSSTAPRLVPTHQQRDSTCAKAKRRALSIICPVMLEAPAAWTCNGEMTLTRHVPVASARVSQHECLIPGVKIMQQRHCLLEWPALKTKPSYETVIGIAKWGIAIQSGTVMPGPISPIVIHPRNLTRGLQDRGGRTDLDRARNVQMRLPAMALRIR